MHCCNLAAQADAVLYSLLFEHNTDVLIGIPCMLSAAAA